MNNPPYIILATSLNASKNLIICLVTITQSKFVCTGYFMFKIGELLNKYLTYYYG